MKQSFGLFSTPRPEYLSLCILSFGVLWIFLSSHIAEKSLRLRCLNCGLEIHFLPCVWLFGYDVYVNLISVFCFVVLSRVKSLEIKFAMYFKFDVWIHLIQRHYLLWIHSNALNLVYNIKRIKQNNNENINSFWIQFGGRICSSGAFSGDEMNSRECHELFRFLSCTE